MTRSTTVDAPAHVSELLDSLHARSLEQESTLRETIAQLGTLSEDKLAEIMRDKFIALEKPKCEFVYTLLRAIGARNVVEAGTSFGVSTIYLALAVIQNGGGRVIATEHEPEKAKIAREHWATAGADIAQTIDLREGDLRQTLQTNMPQIDFLLLDIWTPMALPTFQVVLPHLRPGAVIIADNTVSHEKGYADLLAILRAPGGQFRSLVLPYDNGLEMSVYTP